MSLTANEIVQCKVTITTRPENIGGIIYYYVVPICIHGFSFRFINIATMNSPNVLIIRENHKEYIELKNELSL